jgi:hypothetical protein
MLHSSVAKELPQVYLMWRQVACCQFYAARSGSYQGRAESGINFQKSPGMTVGELRKKLERIDPQTNVVVQWEVDMKPTYLDCRT